MTGDLYSAEKYHEYGLVNRLAEPGALTETTAEFVRTFERRSSGFRCSGPAPHRRRTTSANDCGAGWKPSAEPASQNKWRRRNACERKEPYEAGKTGGTPFA